MTWNIRSARSPRQRLAAPIDEAAGLCLRGSVDHPQQPGHGIRGRDLLSPSALEIDYTAQQAYGAVREPCRAILTAIKWVLERTPPELASDIMKNGIYLTGRAAQLYALDQYIANELNIQVILAKDPGDCTVLGLGYIVENLALLAQQGRMPQLN